MGDPQIIYIVESGEYADYKIHMITLDKTKAAEFALRYNEQIQFYLAAVREVKDGEIL